MDYSMTSASCNGYFQGFADSQFSLASAADFSSWYSQGEALANLGHYGEALRHFEEALSLDSDHVGALLSAAVCLIHLQRPQEALQRCDRILAQAPDHAQAWLFRGVALQRLGQYSAAYAAFAQASAESTGSPRSIGQKIREKLVKLGILI
jgi:tetratricopeptide (TPR) repeat protein